MQDPRATIDTLLILLILLTIPDTQKTKHTAGSHVGIYRWKCNVLRVLVYSNFFMYVHTSVAAQTEAWAKTSSQPDDCATYPLLPHTLTAMGDR